MTDEWCGSGGLARPTGKGPELYEDVQVIDVSGQVPDCEGSYRRGNGGREWRERRLGHGVYPNCRW